MLRRLGLVLLITTIAAGLYWSYQQGVGLADWERRARAWGDWGPVVVGLGYIPASVLMIPGSAITLASAFLFGMGRTLLAVSLGSTSGACAAFLVSRYLARDWVERRLVRGAWLSTLDAAVAQNGFKIVVLTRLSPLLPFGLLNYGFGLSKVPLRTFAVASWLGMLPGTWLYCYLGSAARTLTDLAQSNPSTSVTRNVFLGFGLAATLGVTLLIGRIARRALRDAVPRAD